MGLFDKVLGKSDEKLNEREGVMGIALSAVAADGVLTQEEFVGLANSLGRMRMFQGLTERQFRDSLQKLNTVAQAKGAQELLTQASQAVPKDLRATAFAIAADLLMADGTVAPTEKTFLEKIQRTLEIPDDQALRIVDVLGIKNKG